MKSFYKKLLVLAMLCTAWSCAKLTAEEFVIVENNQSKCSIVVPVNEARYTKWAQALVKYIKASSKAELTVKSGTVDGAVIKLLTLISLQTSNSFTDSLP